MGNLASCVLKDGGPRESVKPQIILPNSDVRYVDGGSHTSAAEVMLEYPGHFLVSARSLRVGSPFMPLAAEDELVGGHVYVMYPMRKVNSVVHASDMGPLLQPAHKTDEKNSDGRIRIVFAGAGSAAEIDKERVGGGLTSGEDERLAGLKMARNRRRSTLETIYEVGVISFLNYLL